MHNQSAELLLIAYIRDNPDVSYTSIAKRLKRSVSTICRLARKHGIEKRNRTPLTLADVQTLTQE